eukprot:362785-Chlamydomonas_euryale.AAC.3
MSQALASLNPRPDQGASLELVVTSRHIVLTAPQGPQAPQGGPQAPAGSSTTSTCSEEVARSTSMSILSPICMGVVGRGGVKRLFFGVEGGEGCGGCGCGGGDAGPSSVAALPPDVGDALAIAFVQDGTEGRAWRTRECLHMHNCTAAQFSPAHSVCALRPWG